MFRSTKTIAIFAVLIVLASILSACVSSNVHPDQQDPVFEQNDVPTDQNDASAEQNDASTEQNDAPAEQNEATEEHNDASAEQDDSVIAEVQNEDGLHEDGLIHVYLVGPGEKVSDFESSFIDYLIYYQESQHLIICMNGKEYTFANVSEALWNDFKNAESKGKFYNEEMKGKTEYHIKDYDGTNGDLILVEHIDY